MEPLSHLLLYLPAASIIPQQADEPLFALKTYFFKRFEAERGNGKLGGGAPIDVTVGQYPHPILTWAPGNARCVIISTARSSWRTSFLLDLNFKLKT